MPRIIYTDHCACGFRDVQCSECQRDQDYTLESPGGECVCHETSSRNCPVHGNGKAETPLASKAGSDQTQNARILDAFDDIAIAAMHADRCGVNYRSTCSCGLEASLVLVRETLEAPTVGRGPVDHLVDQVTAKACHHCGRFSHNPAHPVGTCESCGEEMIFNVPRLGSNGGFIHKRTGQYLCDSPSPSLLSEDVEKEKEDL